MKKSDYFMVLFLTLAVVLIHFQSANRDNKIRNAIEQINENQIVLQEEIQDIQNNYVSFDALQPVLDDFVAYQEEVDVIRNNLNDFNSLWKQLFDYEQERYLMRGR